MEVVAGIVQFQPEGDNSKVNWTHSETGIENCLHWKHAMNLWNPSTWDLSLSFKPEVIFFKLKKADWLAAFMGGVAKSSLTHILDCYCQPM